MCITHPVGATCPNAATDVRIVQLLLNMYSGPHDFKCNLATDGLWGPGTRAALDNFHCSIGSNATQVVPGDPTLQALKLGLPGGLTKQKMWAVMAEATQARIDIFYEPLLKALDRYGVNTPLRIAHFLAQLAHESGCLRYTKELTSGTEYDGRVNLGNVQPGDGPRFKGRGLIQLTGRNNYREYGRACGRDFEHKDDPNLVSDDPDLAVDVAGWFWATRKLNDWADRDDLHEITRRINGGFNGLDQRAAFLARARWLLTD